MMEPSKRKVTAKLSTHDINGHGSTTPTAPSSPQVVVRAKISGTARTRKTSAASTSAASSAISRTNANGGLRPMSSIASSGSAVARRSPSPSKWQPQPSLQRPVRAPLSKAASVPLKSTMERTRHGSISSVLSLGPSLREDPSSSTSAPTTPLPRESRLAFPPAESSSHPTGDVPSVNLNSGSLRIKSKVSGLAKAKPAAPSIPSPPPILPSLSTIISPPSPSSSSVALSARPARTRATTNASGHPSVTLPVFPTLHPQPQTPQLIPLPTSPPTSTLSFSSHSSTSASATSAHSLSSTSTTPPLSSIKNGYSISHLHSRSMSMVDDSAWDRELSPLSPIESPSVPKRTLIARVRPGTSVSGGRGWGSTAGSSMSGGPAGVEYDDRSGETSEADGGGDEDETKHPARDEESLNSEDDVRAEAKSNRKIADLEITTRSLLTINASLEATKVRQAREIRDLRRRLRETRLVLPPKAFRRLQAKDPEPEDDALNPDTEESDVDEDADADADEAFARLRGLVEGLLSVGRKALAEPAPALSRLVVAGERDGEGRGEVLGWETGGKHGVAIGSRVLSPEEARSWVEGEGEGGPRDEEGVESERERTGEKRAVPEARSDTPIDADTEPDF